MNTPTKVSKNWTGAKKNSSRPFVEKLPSFLGKAPEQFLFAPEQFDLY
jgi:hypothetical protein